MLRRAGRLSILVLFLGGLAPASAGAPVGHRIVLVTVDGTDVDDWAAAGAFGSFGIEGVLATWTGAPPGDGGAQRASAYASLGAGGAIATHAGARVTGRHGGRHDGRHGGAIAGLLGESLARHRLLATAIGNASGGDPVMRLDGTAAKVVPLGRRGAPGPDRTADARSASLPVARSDRTAPAGRRVDPVVLAVHVATALRWASVILVDLGDTERADRTFATDPARRRAAVTRALLDADRDARVIRRLLPPGDMLVVASLVPPSRREREGIHLGAIAFEGAPTLPTSGTTRRRGVIALTDLAPTILGLEGIAIPAEMEGRAARFVPADDPRAASLDLDAGLATALRSRRPLTRLWLIGASILSLAAFGMIATGRGRAPGRERYPRRARDQLGVGLLAAAAAPAAFLVAPLLGGHSVTAIGWWTLGLSLGVALVARAALGHERALAAIALADVVLFANDLLAGSPLAGVDAGMLGVLLAAPLVAAAILTDLARDRRRLLVISVLVLALVAFLASAPAFGSSFGASWTLVPAFGVFAVIASGRRIDALAAMGIAIATIVTGALVARRSTSFVKITATTVWLPATVAIAGSALVLAARHRDVVARGMWGHPARRAALWAVAIGWIVATVSNDGGIITVAAAAPIAAACFYGPLLAPDQGDVSGSPGAASR
ncbi:MAG: hypothetical protein E6G68_10420 [Actinobacteria bacterium]|nr:MAG: hypothetical protein E6G68_10420 [Actinomycetota bacterium]